MNTTSEFHELLEALRPFAEHARRNAASPHVRGLPDDCPMAGPQEPPGTTPTLGDCRRALAFVDRHADDGPNILAAG